MMQLNDQVILAEPYQGFPMGKKGTVIKVGSFGADQTVVVRFEDGIELSANQQRFGLLDGKWDIINKIPLPIPGDQIVSSEYDYDREDYVFTVRRRRPRLVLPDTKGSVIRLGTGGSDQYQYRPILVRVGRDAWSGTGMAGNLTDSQVLVKANEAGGYVMLVEGDVAKVKV